MSNRKATRLLPGSIVLLMAVVLTACQHEEVTDLVGTLERDRIELKFESYEPITAIHVQDGQQVMTGDLVLEQDSSRAEARLAQQTALRDQAQARLAELERGPRQEAIRESRARLESLTAERANASARYLRAKDVFDKGLSSEAVLDAAVASWKSTQALETAQTEALESLLQGTTTEELLQAAAAVAASEAVLQQAVIDLQRTRTYAPINGVVDKVLYQLGERPPLGSVVTVLLDDSRSFARVYVPEHLRTRIQPGVRMQVRVDGVDKSLEGTVRWVSADASFTPYFALTEHDRSRLSYLAEIDLKGAEDLPSGVPLVAVPPAE